MVRLVSRLSDIVTEAAKIALGVCVALIVLITLAAVWWRYVLAAPIAWIEQVSNILFIWITFVGAAVLYRQKLHIGVDMFLEKLRGRAKAAMSWVIVTPPVGILLYICANFAGVKLEEESRELGPFLLAGLVVLAIISFLPSTVLWLPRVLVKYGA